jgi:DNA-binding NtrC family response regulator
MGPTKVLVVANAPGILQRVEDTLAGLEVHVAVRLRDVAGTVREGDFNVVVLCMGFEEQSTVELVASLSGEPSAPPPAIVCLAPEDMQGLAAQVEAQMRSAGAAEYINLGDYPLTPKGNDVLRRRILTAAAQRQSATPVTRVLQRAARIAGGTASLAAHLQVAEDDLAVWLQGIEEPSEAVFLAAFDLVLTDLERNGRKPS